MLKELEQWDSVETGEELHRFAVGIYASCRSTTGDGTHRAALQRVQSKGAAGCNGNHPTEHGSEFLSGER